MKRNWYIRIDYIEDYIEHDIISPKLYMIEGYTKHFNNKKIFKSFLNNLINALNNSVDLIEYKKAGFFFENNVLCFSGQNSNIVDLERLKINFRYYCVLQIEELLINHASFLEVDEIINYKKEIEKIIQKYKLDVAAGFSNEYQLYLKVYEVPNNISPHIDFEENHTNEELIYDKVLEVLDNWINYFNYTLNSCINFFKNYSIEEIKNYNEILFEELKSFFIEEIWFHSFYHIFYISNTTENPIEIQILTKFIDVLMNCKSALLTSNFKELEIYLTDVALLPLFIEMFRILDHNSIQIGKFQGIEAFSPTKSLKIENGQIRYIKNYSDLIPNYQKVFLYHRDKLNYIQNFICNYIQAQTKLLIAKLDNEQELYAIHKQMIEKGNKAAIELNTHLNK